MKKVKILLALTLIFASAFVFAGGNKAADTGGGKATLTLGSWRPDDSVQIERLLAEYGKLNPNVTIRHLPINPPDYNATLRLQLDGGTGPDLMYARSYATGAELFQAGYFADASDIPGVKANFTASSLAPWTTTDGKVFAVPYAAVSHGVYYNKTIFRKEGLAIPQTFEDFLKLCATLNDKGYTPLANGVADEWDILECFFLGILPNYIGGASERVKYETGAKKLNDADFTAAFQAMADVAKYLPKGFESVSLSDAFVLFATQKAVMFMDGSWDLPQFDSASFEWGIFAMPAPAGKKTAISFHPDMAITYNKATKYPNEAKAFLAWLATKEGATVAAANMPTGFYPMINFPITLADPHGNEFLALNTGKETDARFVWPKFMDLYAPMNQAVIQVLRGAQTPRQAADEMERIAATLR
ncbi:multiple sugar-binding protein [Spirochaetia bacterium]|nr:multiple sugar-binding protein [Spirochaetia bacterium]